MRKSDTMPTTIQTRGELMLALRKKRMAAAHPFLRGGFRPFFFGAATFAAIAMTLWLFVLSGEIRLPTGFDAVAWHRHEMLFGFVGAAVSGFLLTAIPNWTGQLPIAGKPLLLLFGLWVLARVFVLISGITGLWPAATFDVGLFLSLSALALREVVASKNRNMPVVALVFLFGLADAADYLGTAGVLAANIGWRAAVALMVIMISMIGGRIIPSFTRNWMVKRSAIGQLPTQPQRFDLLVIASSAIALFFWLSFPDHRLTGVMLLLASAAQALRLSRWSGHRTGKDPLVLILHVGYAWLPIGLGLLGLSIAGVDIPESAGIHALTAGAMTTMILAVMSRASLGHTGRELKASPLTALAYLCANLGAALRVAASLGFGAYLVMLDIAGAFWASALLVFLIVYWPVLWRPRLGEQT